MARGNTSDGGIEVGTFVVPPPTSYSASPLKIYEKMLPDANFMIKFTCRCVSLTLKCISKLSFHACNQGSEQAKKSLVLNVLTLQPLRAVTQGSRGIFPQQ